MPGLTTDLTGLFKTGTITGLYDNGGNVALPYDPVVVFVGDSLVLTQGDTANADAFATSYISNANLLVQDATFTSGSATPNILTYTPTTSANAAAGRTGTSFVTNKNMPGCSIGFYPRFFAAYPTNKLTLVEMAAAGATMSRGGIQGTFTGYVSGNVLTLSTGTLPQGNTLITGAGIPAGTVVADFGAGGSTLYVYQAGVSGFGLSFTAGSSGSPITISKYGYSYSPTEGTLYNGTDGSLTNSLKQILLGSLSKMTSNGMNPKIIAVVVMIGTNDAGDATAASRYQNDLSAFMTQIKSNWPLSSAKIILARIQNNGANATTVRAAQQAVADADPQVYLFDTDGIPTSDGTHFTCPTASGVYTGRAAVGYRAYDVWSGVSGGL